MDFRHVMLVVFFIILIQRGTVAKIHIFWPVNGNLFDFFLDGTSSLRMLDVRVPKTVESNGTATLECNFDLEGSDLYVVKWFKGTHEFFRYSPNEFPTSKVFIARHFKVDVSV